MKKHRLMTLTKTKMRATKWWNSEGQKPICDVPLVFLQFPLLCFYFFRLHVLVYWYFMEILQSQCMQGEYEMFNFNLSAASTMQF